MKTNPRPREVTRRAREWADLEPSRTAPPPAAGEDGIRTRAYELWEAAGRPPSDGVPFWLEAERELRRA
jgi:hypothetical protein